MNNGWAARVSAGIGLLAVALGAFGAHGLAEALARHDTAAIWETAVFYHFVHAIMLFVLSSGKSALHRGPWIAFLLGILIFSGSLYLMALTNARWLGMITPLGGVAFLVGWGWLMVKPFRPNTSRPE